MPWVERAVNAINLFFFVYMFAYALVTFICIAISAVWLDGYFTPRRHMAALAVNRKDNYVPISIIVPAYNEAVTICTTIHSLLRLDYPQYEIIIVDDGSSDDTAELLIEHFHLKQVVRPVRIQTPSLDITHVYQNDEGVTLARKPNGGKSDALNAGINLARYPLFVCVDADSILQEDALTKIVYPFTQSDDTIAVGGHIKVANAAEIHQGRVTNVVTPKNALIGFQMVEYARVFLGSRAALNALRANMLVSGAFGVFRKSAVVAVGGYRREAVGEDMDLVVRLNAHYRKNRLPYNIDYVPDAICWSQAPQTLAALGAQRVRWQAGMGQALRAGLGMLFNPRFGAAGLLAHPYYLFFEFLAPILETVGLVTIGVSLAFGMLDIAFCLTYLLLYASFHMLSSVVAIGLEGYFFPKALPARLMPRLLLFAFLENLGYRQLCACFRLFGCLRKKRASVSWSSAHRTAMEKDVSA